MAAFNIDGDLNVRGKVTAYTLGVPTGSVGDAQVSASSPITAEKVEHQYAKGLAQAHGVAATAERRAVHVAFAAGEVLAVRAGAVVAATGNSTVTVDVLKNGTTVLSAPVVLDNTNVAYAEEAGTVTVPAYAAGDWIEVAITVSAGTGTLPQGVFADVVLREAAG